MTNGDIYDIPYHNRVDMYIEVIRLTYEYDLRFPENTASSQAADTGTRKDADAKKGVNTKNICSHEKREAGAKQDADTQEEDVDTKKYSAKSQNHYADTKTKDAGTKKRAETKIAEFRRKQDAGKKDAGTQEEDVDSEVATVDSYIYASATSEHADKLKKWISQTNAGESFLNSCDEMRRQARGFRPKHAASSQSQSF